MMSRLTIVLSVVVFSLSGFVVYTIFNINNEVKNYTDSPIVVNSKNKVPNETSQTPTDGESGNATTGSSDQIIDDSTNMNNNSNMKNYNLNEEELYSLLNSGNPFGNSLSKNNAVLKEKIDKQVEENRKMSATDSTKQYAKKEDVKEIAELKAKKYDIPSEWIINIIEETSKYQTNMTTNENGVIRKGIMQIREDKLAFISESIGVFYQPNIEEDLETNIEMGAYYLSYLSKQKSDTHYIFTSYDLGPTGAKEVYEKNGNYETDFSKKIAQLQSSN